MKASLPRRAWQPLKRLISRLWGPRMVYGFVRGDGDFLPNTRISNSTAVFARDRLDVADHVFIGHFSVLDATYGLRIGEGCQIGFFTGVFTHSSHAAVRLYGREYLNVADKQAYSHRTRGESVPTASSAPMPRCCPGTKLGKGSLVSAYSLVQGEFPDYAILAGQPARVVGDTRIKDAELLRRHPELAVHYQAWAGELPR